MRKSIEMKDPRSCLNRAAEGEMLFVLLGRDIAAPKVIRYWAQQRVEMGKNTWTDPQIQEALACADSMETHRKLGKDGAGNA